MLLSSAGAVVVLFVVVIDFLHFGATNGKSISPCRARILFVELGLVPNELIQSFTDRIGLRDRTPIILQSYIQYKTIIQLVPLRATGLYCSRWYFLNHSTRSTMEPNSVC